MKKLFYILIASLTLAGFTACNEGDDLSTNQYKGGISLNAFGPSPVIRGGEIRFVGSGMDQVTEVVFPTDIHVTDIRVVSSEEIRVTVPAEDVEPGILELVTAKGSLFTKSELTYTEPILLNSFSPATVKPGEVLTINGDYLNLMHGVIFEDEVYVFEENFIEHSRYTIKVKVPAEAQTGRIGITDAVDMEAEMPNEMYSEDALTVVLPAVTSIADLTGKKPGDVITQTVSDLDLVERLTVADMEVEFTAADGAITYTLPENTPLQATVSVWPASGVECIIAYIGMTIPTELVATPSTGIKAGNTVVISGKDLDVVSSVTFAGSSAAVEPEEQSSTAITVTVPADAQSGDVTLNLKSGATAVVAIETAKPELTAYSPVPVSAGSELTITGKNLETVAKVKFVEDLTVTEFAEQSEEKLVLTVPVTAVTGKLTITMSNGETVEFDELNVDSPVFCFIPELPGDDVELKAGQLMQVTVVNADVLTNVQVDGADVQYILIDDVLYIGLPTNAGKSSKLKLISSNGEVEYAISVIPNTEQTFVIWTGAVDLNAWAINWTFGENAQSSGENAKAFADIELQEGDIIRVWATNYNDKWQIQFFDGHWGRQDEIGVATGLNNNNNINNDIYDLSAGYIEIPVTATLAEQLTTLNDWGYCWIIQGEGLIISKIDVVRHISLETTLWEGEAVADDWGNQPYLLSDGGAELAEFGAKVGQTIRFYITPTDAEWKLQILEGHWTGVTYADLSFESWDLAANNGAVSIVVTEDMLTAAYTKQGWGGSFLGNGDNVVITKITIE